MARANEDVDPPESNGGRIMTALLTPVQAAERLSVPVSRLRDMRYQGRGPVFIKVGRSVRYDETDLQAWIDANRATSTKETL